MTRTIAIEPLDLEIMARPSRAGTIRGFRRDGVEKMLPDLFSRGWRLPTVKEARVLGEMVLLGLAGLGDPEVGSISLDNIRMFWTSEPDETGGPATQWNPATWVYIHFAEDLKSFRFRSTGTGWYFGAWLVRDL